MPFCARMRFKLGERVRINYPGNELVLAEVPDHGEDVRLMTSPKGQMINEAEPTCCVAREFPSETEAHQAGVRRQGRIEKAFARLNIRADFGGRGPTSMATYAGLKMLEEQHSCRVLNEVHGLMVFECEPWPRFEHRRADRHRGRRRRSRRAAPERPRRDRL